MSRYSLGTPAAADLIMDNHPNDLLRIPSKETSDNTSPNSSYSSYPFSSEQLKSSHSSDDKDGSAFANSLIAQSLNADGTPKRPMNAFMIFARKRRPEVSAANQMMRTGEISKILSKEWNAMDISEKQFYLDQAKRLKDTFNSKYPDYVYRRRPNNSRKRRKNDAGALSITDPDDLPGDTSPIDDHGLDDRGSQYSFGGQNPQLSTPSLGEMFPQNNTSTLHSHGYSYPYPQSRHQSNGDYSSHRSSLQGSLSFPHSSSHSHVPSLRSAPAYSSHDQPSLPLSQNHISGTSYQSSQSSQNGYWSDRTSGSPHNNGTSYSSASSTSNGGHHSSSNWSSSMLPPIPSHFPAHNGTRERSYTTTALPTVKSTFSTHGSSPGLVHPQLPLPPLNSVGNGNSSGGGSGVPHRPWSSGPNSQSGNGGNYLPTLNSPYYPPSSGNGPLNSPSSSNTSSSYLPSPPGTASSTSTGTPGGGDSLLTPPELTYDLPRPAVGELPVGSGYGWDRK
ncbi:hypothetical protein BJ322DRAFT_1024303 [Thelephora terrestris]|uniref:HMG box domain-containing protein n=1 Tax=Thelephora terrestris TaxID=56493 RepID=A0A9P6H7Q3_9AGAM|nr:hypothetical protein BJ322DRAFT_1024303 [Thelephora terrestris]